MEVVSGARRALLIVAVLGVVLLAESGARAVGAGAGAGAGVAQRILAQHYDARAMLHPIDEFALGAASVHSGYSVPRTHVHAAADAEEDAAEEQIMGGAGADAVAEEDAETESYDAANVAPFRMPTAPPPPPFDAVFMELESRIADAEAAHTDDAARTVAAAKAKAVEHSTVKATVKAGAGAGATVGAGAAAKGKANAVAGAKERAHSEAAAKARLRGQERSAGKAKGKARAKDPFPEQPFTYKDVNSPPEWLVPEESEPAGPTTKPPPVPQMIPPPPPVPFPTYNYHDPNSAGPFSQYAPGVQGWGYDGGYAGPYDGFSMYGHPPNGAQTRGWMNPSIPRTAAQIASATAASQYHPWGAPPPLYSMGSPPPDGAASWVPLGAFLQPGTLEGGAGEDE